MSDAPAPGSRRLSPEAIAALAAVAISVCASVVSVYETSLIRQQLKGSVWPHVDVGIDYSGDAFRYTMTNTGVGPARIRYAVIRVDGEPVTNWDELFNRLEIPVGSYTFAASSGRALPPGDRVENLVVEDPELAPLLFASLSRVTGEICYCSVHDDCWTRMPEQEPVPVQACVTGETLFRQ